MLLAALGERPRRLALEIDDQEIVVRDQHLAEVVVAVVPRLQRRALGRGAGIYEGEDLRFLGGDGFCFLVLLHQAQRLIGFLPHARTPGLDVLRRERLGLEGRVAALHRKGAMQLRRARGERLDERQVRTVRFVLAQAFDEALQIGEAVAPGVALVHHIGLQERHGCTLACGRQVFHRAGERHAVLEVRHFGEEAPDLELRMDAGPDAAEALEEQAIAELHGGVGALRVQPGECEIHHFAARHRGEGARRREAQRAICGRQRLLLADRLHHVAAERLVRQRVGHHADIRLLANARDGERRERAHVILVLFPAERERQEILAIAHLDEGEEPADRACFPDHMVQHLRLAHRLALLRVPALGRDEVRQHLLLQPRAQLLGHADAPGHHLVAEEAGPAVEQDHHRRLLVQQHFLVPVGGGLVLRETEPVEGVGRQRDEVRQVADRRKRGAAEQFHRDSAPEFF